MYRFSHYLGLAGLIVVGLSTDAFSQGNSVGINTATPNPNAVLQLISPNNNQGLLIPRLTTSQRLAMQLQASEKGLMVFDDTEGLFYYWNGSAWNKLLVSQNLQTLSLDGSLLKVSGANEVDLAGIDTDKQNLTFEGTNLTIERGNTVDLSSLITTSDADPENELQSLEFNSGELKLTNDPTSAVVDLSNYDTDVTDDFDGDYNSLTNLPTLFSGDFGDLGNVPADLADGDDVDDADADASNEIQTIIAGTGMTVTPSGINYTVTNAAPDQTVALNNGGSGNLTITGSYPNFTLDVPSVNDADADPNNEDQTVSAGTGISVVQTGDDFQVTNTSPDQTVALNNGGSGFLTITGTYPNFTLDVPSVNDADASTANEIQTITAGTGMTVTPSGINYTIANAAPDQTVVLADGGAGNVTIGGTYPNLTIDVPSLDDADASTSNEIQTITAGTGMTVTPSGINYTIANAAPDQTVVLADGGAGNVTIGGTYPNLTVNVPTLDDADADPNNEIQDLNLTTNTLTITNNGSATSINLSPYLDNTDAQNLSLSGTALSISGGTGADLSSLVDDADADPTNEIQVITAGTGMTVTPSGINYTIANAAPDQTVVLADGGAGNVTVGGTYPNLTIDVPSLDDADASTSNEIQTITAGTGMTVTPSGINYTVTNAAPDQTVALNNGGSGNLTITGSYPNFTLDVPSVNDADADPNNEDQTVSAGTGISVVQTGDDFQVTNTSPDQTVALNNGGSGFLTITGTYPNFTLDVPSVNDADASTANEIQTITAGTGMTVTPSGINYTVTNAAPDQTVVLADGGAGNVTIGGTYPNLTIDVLSLDDADADPTNEIQDLDLTANTLTITNNGSATNIDLSPYQQTISKSGNTVSLTNGGSFALGSTAPSSVGQVLKWNGSDWGAGSDNVNDADADATNEFQTLGLAGNILSLTGSGTTIDLTPLGVLPAQSAPLAGYFLGTNGANASWMPLGALAFADDVSSAQIQDGAVGVFDLNTAVAGNGLTGGGGVALAANVAPTGGLEVSSDQLQIKDVVVGTTYNILIGGAITYNNKGQITATGPSDETLKTNIEQIQGVLDKLMQVNGYTYYWKSDENGMIQYGVIAQQLEKYFPELIMNNPSGIKSVSYQGLIPILIEALKEEHARVSDLKEEVEEMKAQLSSNDERFKTLEAKLDLLIQSTTTAKAPTSSQE